MKAICYGSIHKRDRFKHRFAIVVLASLAAAAATLGHAVERTSAIVGATVVTQDGQRVGQVVDLALDPATHRIDYYVVSIGSFLVADSLIAVHPDAMLQGPAAEELTISVNPEALLDAQRFNATSWPETADLFADKTTRQTPSASTSASSGQPNQATQGQPTKLNATGSATISDGRRQATLADGKKAIAEIQATIAVAPEPAAAPSDPQAASTAANPKAPPSTPAPYPAFAQLDDNGDGRLSRREIGSYLRKHQGFSRVDLDDSGGIDRFEYDVLRQAYR